MLFELEPECAMAGVRLATAHPSRKMPRTLAVSHDDSHPQAKPIWNGFSARLRRHRVPLHKLAAGSLGKCKSSILSKFSQGTPGAEWRTGCPGWRAPREGRILSASGEQRVQKKMRPPGYRAEGRP